MGDILCKVHSTASRLVVALCDREVYGRKLVDGAFCLNLDTPFFKGDELDEQAVRAEIKRTAAEDATFNIVGEKSVAIARDMEIITEEGIRRIDGVPIALVLL